MQPRSLPRTSANTRQKRLKFNVTNPTQSTQRARDGSDSEILANVMMIATTPIGTLTKKIQRHPMPLAVAPPMSGPHHRATDPRTVHPKAVPLATDKCPITTRSRT